MFLADCNIQDLVTEQINDYLAHSEFSFIELQSTLISKTPVAEIQTRVATILKNAEKSDFIKVKKRLEEQAFLAQGKEDVNQKDSDLNDSTHDDDLKERLNRELNLIPDDIIDVENDRNLARQKLWQMLEKNTLVQVASPTPVTNKSKKKLALSNDEDREEIQRLERLVYSYDLKINTLNDRKRVIHKKLKEIEKKNHDRHERLNKRTIRNQAREAYKSSGEGILSTLSPANQLQLTKSIQEQQESLNRKCISLIQEAAEINFPTFIEQLQSKLQDLKLSKPEIEALHHILKLMNQHIKHEHLTVNYQDMLSNKKQGIIVEKTKLKTLQTKLKALTDANPNLATSNKKLIDENKQLQIDLENNSTLRQYLMSPALLLLFLTFISVVPLILTLKGIIPFFMAPVLVYSLFSVIPALLLIATLAVGIAALVYSSRAQANEITLSANLQTISHNTNEKKHGTQEIKNLRETAIPSLEAQIKKDEATKNTLITSIEESRRLAEQTLQQAKAIEPISFATSTVLSPSISRHNSAEFINVLDEHMSSATA